VGAPSTSPTPGEWLATATVPDGVVAGGAVTFTVSFTTPDGKAADAIAATTDGSKLYLSSDEGLIDGAFKNAAVLRPDGVVDAAWTQTTAKMFDGDAASHSDSRLNAGIYGNVWDFGADAKVSVTGAELLVRQDGYGTSRISDMRLEGSDDLQTWTRLTPAVPTKTLDWQQWSVQDPTAHRYVRIANGQILGVAELRLFGSVTPVDRVAPSVTVKEGVEFTVGSDGVYRSVSFKLRDDGLVDRVSLNGVEKDVSDNAWSDLNFVTPGMFGAVEGANTLVVSDVAGNTATVAFVLDTTGPKVSVKTGDQYTIGADGVYDLVSFKLQDAPGRIDRLSVNGTAKDLTNNVWSDLNFVKPGAFGAIEGQNTLVVYDSLGNSTTVPFILEGE